MKFLLTIIVLIFTQFISAQAFDFVVSKDGSGTDTTIQSAINKCPDGVRSVIYIKKGNYLEHISIGTKTNPSNQLISLIGEHRDCVRIYWDKSMGTVSTFEEATCLQVYSKEFYAENITLANTAGNTGQALALYNAGDMFILKNCTITGYQDTYRSKKSTRGYISNCMIKGATDFIYAGGTVFIEDSEIRCVQGGGYICAPEDAVLTIPKLETVCGKFLRIEYIFRNCSITSDAGVSNGSYYLGRPWNSYSGCFYLNCKMGSHINSKGWQTWGGNETTASFGEYNSMDLQGNLLDVSGRASWSFQLPQADVDKLFTTAGIYARLNPSVLFDPVPKVQAIEKVQLSINETGYHWNPVAGARGYMILKGGQYVTSTTATSYQDLSMSPGMVSIVTIGSLGQLSDPVWISTGLETNKNIHDFRILGHQILMNTPRSVRLFDMNGKQLHSSLNSSMQSGQIKINSYNATSYVLTVKEKGNYILELNNQSYKIQIRD